MEISVKKVLSANPYELSKLAFALNKAAVQDAFARVGILVESESDLKQLARLHATGGDEAGEFKNNNGESIYFDFQDVLANVEMSEDGSELIKELNLNWD